jgi:hypothetical protein
MVRAHSPPPNTAALPQPPQPPALSPATPSIMSCTLPIIHPARRSASRHARLVSPRFERGGSGLADGSGAGAGGRERSSHATAEPCHQLQELAGIVPKVDWGEVNTAAGARAGGARGRLWGVGLLLLRQRQLIRCCFWGGGGGGGGGE